MADENKEPLVPFFFPPGMGPAEIARALRAAAERVVRERAEREAGSPAGEEDAAAD